MLSMAFGMIAMVPAVFGFAGYVLVSDDHTFDRTVAESACSTVDLDVRTRRAIDGELTSPSLSDGTIDEEAVDGTDRLASTSAKTSRPRSTV